MISALICFVFSYISSSDINLQKAEQVHVNLSVVGVVHNFILEIKALLWSFWESVSF